MERFGKKETWEQKIYRADVSLHLLEVALNSVESFAKRIEINFFRKKNVCSFTVKDNGCGMDERTLRECLKHGFSTKGDHRGRGLSLLEKDVTNCGGALRITSEAFDGTNVYAEFIIDSTNNVIEGKVEDSVATLLSECENGVDFLFEFITESGEFTLDTTKIPRECDGSIPIQLVYRIKNEIKNKLK